MCAIMINTHSPQMRTMARDGGFPAYAFPVVGEIMSCLADGRVGKLERKVHIWPHGKGIDHECNFTDHAKNILSILSPSYTNPEKGDTIAV